MTLEEVWLLAESESVGLAIITSHDERYQLRSRLQHLKPSEGWVIAMPEVENELWLVREEVWSTLGWAKGSTRSL